MMPVVKHFKHIFSFAKPRHYIGLLIVIIVCSGAFICTAFNKISDNGNPPVYSDFAGNEACVSCHNDICESQQQTAHYHTSAPASADVIKGSFLQGENTFTYNAFMQAEMDTADGIAYQTALANGVAYETHSFDISVGSGRKGQTYLYWSSNQLYQLPVSYFTPLHTWCNSPGYPANFIKFDRNINARCLECHGTYAKAETSNGIAAFDKAQIMYGIQCERCHGAAAKHVAYEQQHPADTTGMFVRHIKNLSRQQKLDLCALCHSGVRNSVMPSFTYEVGEELDYYLTAAYKKDSVSMLDVHGNQYGLLTSSKCFQLSQMDCSSCHNTHVTERGSKALFSQRCTTCHNDVRHSFVTPEIKNLINTNCVDCHMPSLPSSKITLLVSGKQKTVPDYVTTHRIAIYPEQTKTFLQSLNR